jgi:hypothetical protein
MFTFIILTNFSRLAWWTSDPEVGGSNPRQVIAERTSGYLWLSSELPLQSYGFKHTGRGH